MTSVLSDDPVDLPTASGDPAEPGGPGDLGDAGDLFVAPASFAQARLWLLDRIEPGLAAYNVPLVLEVGGPLAPATLAAALHALAERHETLRTALAEDLDGGGLPVEVISPAASLPLAEVDLTGLGERAGRAALAEVYREAARPFDLGRLPLARAVLFRLAPAAHLLVVNLHHAVTDAWSLEILLRDLLTFYAAALDGRPAALPELPIQYADFAAWQRDWLQGEALAERLRPWRRRLEGAPGTIALPTDRPRGVRGGFDRRGGHAPFVLPGALAPALRELGRSAGATSFMVLLAGFEALLARLSGQGDLVVGTTVANRDRSEVENLIGLFVNTLALRGELADDPPFAGHLARVREATIEAFDHADLPFEKLVEELKPERRLAENPLFEVSFAFQRPPLEAVGNETAGLGLELGILQIDTGTAKFELVLHLIEGHRIEGGDDALSGFWEYRRALYDRTTIERLTLRLETLLADAAAHPERRISELALLSPAERHQVAIEWTAVAPAEPLQPLAYELFAAQAERTPELPAASFGDATLTYRELRARAERLARRLAARGAGRERPVGLLVERSLDLPLGVLAALAAGAAYVPLDPEYPEERLALLLADAGVAVVAAQANLRERLPATELPVVVFSDAGDDAEGDQLVDDIPAATDPADLAYVLFTSGSTGRPKGVAMAHGALANLLAWQLATGGDQEGLATLQFAPLSFDASFQEMLGTWGAGGHLVLVPEEVRRDPEALADFLDRRLVGRIFFPSIALQQLAQAVAGRPGSPAPRALRELVTAGEQLQVTPAVRSLVARLDEAARTRPPAVRLHNHYGPTEAHVVTALLLPPGEHASWPALPSIGRPIPGAVIRLLDSHLAPVPIGVPGGLYIGGMGGACLARGYRRRPDLTAERFLPDPVAESPGARLYATGDLARFRPDGILEYLGRGDSQVKVRGVRVEPAEVEAALGSHPRVAECAVVARKNAAGAAADSSGALGETYLAAYVVSRGGPALAGRELRDFLRGKLPDALVPAVFVELAALPRTPSAKVDRAALPDPGVDGSEAAGYVAPRTPVEEVLAGIWSGVLRLSRIGALDNFFDLGGHSLNATTVTAQVRSTFRVELPARAVFEAPTLAELAGRIERLVESSQGLALPPIEPRPRGIDGVDGANGSAGSDGSEAPLSFSQRRLWFLDRLAGGESPFYNIAAALGLAGRLSPAALAAALSAIVRRHEALRTTFRAGTGEAAGEAVQVVHPPAPFALPLIDLDLDLDTLPEPDRSETVVRGELARLARAHGRRPFDLARGPLLRATLLRLGGAENHALLLSMHHIVSDGWSLDVFVRELAELYAAAVEGRRPELPELPVQYADFALWQRRWLGGPALDAQLAYWREALAGAPFSLDLPTDRPRPPVETYAGRTARLHLPAALAEPLRAVARGERATLFMVLLAAFAALLERQSGQDDMLLGTPIANRNRAEVEGLIGAFVNTLVLRVERAAEGPFGDLLVRVRETALGAYAHQDLPFERLVEALQPARDLSRNPLFQVLVSLAATPWHELERSGLALGSLGLETEDAAGEGAGSDLEIFDLTLQVFETPHGLDGRLAYNSDLFDAATVARLGRQLEALLAAVAEDPERAPAAVPLATASERRQLLAEWSGASAPTAVGQAAEPGVLARFLAQAAARPEAPAIALAGGEISYEDLDRRSNRLARHLAAAGAGPEVLVALALDGTADFATAVLAVWKAGAAYLPLPPDLPRERAAHLLADSGARLVVARGTGAPAADRAEASPGAPQVVDLAADAAAIARRDAAPFAAPHLPESLAYVIYTSGSTGRPKGVAVSQGALAAHAVEIARALALSPADRVLQVASFAFDVSIDELAPALLSGAALVPGRREAAEPASLARALAERAITLVNLPTALWHQSARAWAEGRLPVAPAALRALRQVIAGGEAMPADGLALWRRTPLAAVPLANGYGPTEAVVTATLHPTGPDAPPADLARMPLGRPFPGRRLYLLDRRGELAPPGAVGEIHLGGAPLARGYLGRPEATAAAFVPDPFSDPGAAPGSRQLDPGAALGARLYRTGDLARFRGDGCLEFLGRRDQQVKVRGFRIEPAEVEAALLAHPAVTAAAVVLADGAGDAGDAPGRRTLAAYLAVEAGRAAPPAAELRAFLGERLPAYMIPASFAVLPALPLTPGGKVDRAALPAAARAAAPPALPEAPRSEAEESAAQPPVQPAAQPADAKAPRETAALEALVAAVWRDLLGIEQVGTDDNFFDLGGHSMLLAPALARLQEGAAAPGLTLLDLFDHPTVSSLARHLLALGAALPARAPEPAAPRLAAAPAPRPASGEAVAIVGLAGRFPGAADVETFWRNLREGVESIARFTPGGEPWRPPAGGGTFQVPMAGVLDGPELWDAELFGYSRREAELMDPQQRLFLECAWEAMEDAGYGALRRRGAGRVAVFGGAAQSDYLMNLVALGLLAEPAGSEMAMVGNEKDYLAARVSYKLDLEGPSFTVAAACSSGLVAVHLACESLLSGACDMALAGGASVGARRREGYLHRAGGMLSPSGRCRPFDAAADGAVDSDGVGMVALKRLSDAVAAGDTIRAVVRGSAIVNDGAGKLGFLAPRTAGRAAAVAAALARAGVSPAEVSFVESHGNGTPLGDAIEVAALNQAFGAGGGAGSTVLGAVKSNIGHTHGASGAIGLIKAALALERREIPPTLHFERPAAEIDLAAGPFRINTRLEPWETNGAPRRAGVSAFGHGGINVHVVLEEAPAPRLDAASPKTRSEAAAPDQAAWHLLLLSARSAAALDAAAARLAEHLARHPELPLEDVAFTLQVGREPFAHRRALLCRDLAQAVRLLAAADEPASLLAAPDAPRAARSVARRARRHGPAVAFLLSDGAAAASLDDALAAADRESIPLALPIAGLPAPAALLAVLGSLWLAGVDVDWAAYHGGSQSGRRRVPLPTYPFERQRYWTEPPEDAGVLRSLASAAAEDV